MTYRLVAIPGDGVGPEVAAGARVVVDAAARTFGFEVEWTEILAGGAAIDAYGIPIRPEDLARCESADAVLLGAVGGPQWDDLEPSIRPERALFALRKGLELFANLRPVRVMPALIESSPVRPELVDGVDLIIVRELTGGVYFGPREEAGVAGSGERVARDTLPYSESEIRRLLQLAFTLARARKGHVTSVDKANVLATSRLWRTVAEEVHAEFPDVELAHQLVDSCAMQLIKDPARFDILAMDNMFGDILSDEASVLVGSLGMLPSASIGERRTAHGRLGVYEPCHGSAPRHARLDRANPIGTILSAAMLARWSLGREDVATAIEGAVTAALDDGYRTADLGSGAGTTPVGTRDMARVIAERLRFDAAVAAVETAPA